MYTQYNSLLTVVKLRSGEGLVRVKKVRVRSQLGTVQLRSKNLKIWT